jgi:hypothetical protein
LFVLGDKVLILGLISNFLDVQQFFIVIYIQLNLENWALLGGMGAIWSELEADLPFLLLEVGLLLLDLAQKQVLDMSF